MFTTCIHCTRDLGTNEALEEFPVGGRIAFDPAKGRLWVVCRSCERWNLSPLEERWEAIEAAERRFRDARLRVSTDNVGMARLREGLDLIRIGEPLRPEMAAWRYGDQFGRRRQRQLIFTGGLLGAAAIAAGGLVWAGAIGFSGVWFGGNIGRSAWDRIVHGNPRDIIARIPRGNGRTLVVERSHARMSLINALDDHNVLSLVLRHRGGEIVLSGDEAMRAAAQVLPVVNRFGGSRKLVASSVDLLEERGGALETIRFIKEMRGSKLKRHLPLGKKIKIQHMTGALHALPARERLALEMALHEESERRAMDGELHELERAWREAEEVAQIADNLLSSATVDERMKQLHRVDEHEIRTGENQ